MHLEWSTKTWKGFGKIRTRRKNRDHPDYSIVENGRNIEKFSGDQKRLAVIQTTEKKKKKKKRQQTLMWKSRN